MVGSLVDDLIAGVINVLEVVKIVEGFVVLELLLVDVCWVVVGSDYVVAVVVVVEIVVVEVAVVEVVDVVVDTDEIVIVVVCV